ncbi:AraC family transcriptional regulator [Terrihabitans rhizophilus]|uniref:AraC family transcriptional regulator n=1 Tax=Terrihabitans rhizophilus TaxID=3092662 RepID=A0ABU4RPY1_9HYPH|nr:AraC family transcriptional regulator [Terrihabitans sp. PJ23]MDX6806922.1 AraC family transcriptional regulator [Terrihabitans sp. PJ23]
MTNLAPEFRAEETLNFSQIKGFTLQADSTGLGWSSLYVSHQSEAPYTASLSGKPVILVSALDVGPVRANVAVAQSSEHLRAVSGAVSIVPDMHDLHVDLVSAIKTTHVYVKRSLFDEVAGSVVKSDPQAIIIRPRMGVSDPFLHNLCNEAREALQGNPEFSALYVEHLARILCAYLIRKYSTAVEQPVSASDRELGSRTLSVIRDFIEAHLDEPVTINDIADQVKLGPDQLSRRFKITTGMTLYQFVIRSRIDAAQRLLRETDTPIALIALECGFGDQVSFTRSFKKVTGSTPGAFRSNNEEILISVDTRRRR